LLVVDDEPLDPAGPAESTVRRGYLVLTPDGATALPGGVVTANRTWVVLDLGWPDLTERT